MTNTPKSKLDRLLDAREIDCLIAEKVMGFGPPGDKQDFNTYPGINWCPSTDIAAAWEVFNSLKSLEVKIDGPDRKDPVWRVQFRCPNTWDDLGTAEAEAAPMAICKAALKTAGVDIEKEKE